MENSISVLYNIGEEKKGESAVNREYVLKNYEMFYNMVLSVALMGTYNSKQFDSDAESVIDFIALAYNKGTADAKLCSKIILGDMMKIGLVADYHALASSELLKSEDEENRLLYEIKGRVIEKVNCISSKTQYSPDNRLTLSVKQGMKYDTFHHEYEPYIRYQQIKEWAYLGDVTSLRQIGIQNFIGLGCEKDIDKAITYFTRCMFWGDCVAAQMLSYVHRTKGDFEKSKTYSLVSQLMLSGLDCKLHSLANGKKDTDGNVDEIFLCIESIKREIINKFKICDVDITLTDILSDEQIGLKDKLSYIYNYRDSKWKQMMLGEKEAKAIGF